VYLGVSGNVGVEEVQSGREDVHRGTGGQASALTLEFLRLDPILKMRTFVPCSSLSEIFLDGRDESFGNSSNPAGLGDRKRGLMFSSEVAPSPSIINYCNHYISY